jgi:hypothetical protein
MGKADKGAAVSSQRKAALPTNGTARADIHVISEPKAEAKATPRAVSTPPLRLDSFWLLRKRWVRFEQHCSKPGAGFFCGN